MNSRKHIELLTPIGTEGVRIEGAEIVGRWKPNYEVFSGFNRRLLVEDFLNWGNNPNDIVRFTERYGPVSDEDIPPRDWDDRGEFRFQTHAWREIQGRLQAVWEFRSEVPRTVFLNFHVGISIENQRVSLNASLMVFLLMELAFAPADRLRKCKADGCVNPYFVATHKRQVYCTPKCAESAQARWKANWWKKKGANWLRKRKAATKSAAAGLKRKRQ
jgi:hypothetical protein